MKTLLFTLLVAVSALAQAPVAPKRPLGVPADAKPFNGRWYKVVLEKKSWHAARDKCKDMGGRLVCVPDAVTWEFVKTLNKGPQLWIGATDEKTTGVWEWVNGDRLKFSAWSAGQPDNAGKVQHYMILNQFGMFDDVGKNSPNTVGFICEWK